MKTTKVYKQLESCSERIILLQGGAGSSKSYSTAQFLRNKLKEDKNLSILVVRKYKVQHRFSTKVLLKELIDNNILFKKIVFSNCKNINSLYDYIWIEEATDISKKEFIKILDHLKDNGKIILTFNPFDKDKEHWLRENIENSYRFHSTYKDNPFMSKDFIKYLESVKEEDINFYKVYTLGEWA